MCDNLKNALNIVKWKYVVIVISKQIQKFYNIIISYLVLKIYKFKMGCSVKKYCQDNLRLKEFAKFII